MIVTLYRFKNVDPRLIKNFSCSLTTDGYNNLRVYNVKSIYCTADTLILSGSEERGSTIIDKSLFMYFDCV